MYKCVYVCIMNVYIRIGLTLHPICIYICVCMYVHILISIYMNIYVKSDLLLDRRHLLM